ncbi:hypothetical protein TTHERM_00764080 (macronuclear) [Tetrahymena thermophila SB210]|uniref:PH domain protein n=1 Tax=Tetrahymena thermophila (strain SB210) TaxID=312017 RepID=I7LXQ0_TETTS|nr:hypothetical protein TTHERM_00764080 [Tetrahymena thermophila SB210]EAS05122.2 hypothetical protein TTHERM_00764080 [Tetrahymena thermophila SB210]|eukprot:XP_001025367.2 hypothetical protein TTHERM_00764080 [Tetrahymena thermophila SB210]
MSEHNQNTILANIPIKKSSKETMKSNRNIMINFENQLQQKVEDMFKTDGLKILVKRGKTFGLLTTRYYKIVRDFLYYYKSKAITSKPKGILNLRDSSLKVELEYGKIIKEKQFGLKVQGAKTHGVFWLVSQNQAENITLFKYLKLLNGQFQIKQLPLLSNRNLRGGNSQLINNSLCSQVEGGLENMISEEKINQIEFMDAQLNLALRNVDSSVVLKIEKPQIEDINGVQYNSSKQVCYIGEENKNDNTQYAQQNINQNILTNLINGIKDRSNNQYDNFQIERKEISQQPNVISIKRDFLSKKYEVENEQIFEEEEGFKNKQWGQIQYHNSSTYFGESQKQSTKKNNGLNYSSQQNLGIEDKIIHLELQISPKKKQPHTASSLNERNSTGNKSHLYQINYSPNFNNMYGQGYDDEFLQREIGDVQLPSSPKQIIQFDDDYDEEYIDYYGEINLNYTNGIGSAITSQNTLNKIKKPQADITNPSSQILLLNQNTTTQQNLSQNQILLVEASSNFTQMLSPIYQQQESNFLRQFNPNEDYAQQLNLIKEQGKKIEESIKTSEQMLNYYKEQYEQIKKSTSCLDEAEELHEKNKNNQILSEIYSNIVQTKKQQQSTQIKNSSNQYESHKPIIHNQSKSDINLLHYIYEDQFYEDVNYNQEQVCQFPYQNQYNSHNSIEFKLQLNDKLKNKSAPHSPNTSILRGNKFINKSEQDENIAEDSEEGSNDQFNSRYCRNMDILSNNNPHQRTQTDLALEEEAVANENSGEEDDYYLSEKPREDNFRSSNCNEIKESKYQSGISNKTTNYQTSEYKIVLNEEQKKLNKEMKEICNQENSLKQIEDLDFKILDEIKDEVGRNVSQINKPNLFSDQQNSNIRRSKSAISQKNNGTTNQIKFKARASVKNISQRNIYDEGEGGEDESECIDNPIEYSEKMNNKEDISNKYRYEEDEVIQSSKIIQKESIQIDSSGNVIKQLEQSFSQGSSNSQSVSPQPRNSPTKIIKKQENDQKEFTLSNSYKKKQIIELLEKDLKQSKDTSSQKTAQNFQQNELTLKKSQNLNQTDVFEFQDNRISEVILNCNSIYACLEEICQMIWKNFIREAQEQIKILKQRFSKKQFLIDIAELEIDLLIISFSGQVENLNFVCEKVDQILKSIKLEQKQKQNFYDLCLCDINQAELFLIKGIIQYIQNKKL